MKNKIIESLKTRGFDEKKFKISITSGLTKNKDYEVDCRTVSKTCQYILLYIESLKIILIWDKRNIFSKCSISKGQVLNGLNQNMSFVKKGIEFKNRKEQKVYISSVDDIGETILKIVKEER